MKSEIGVSILSFAHGHAGMYCQKMMEFADVKLISAWDDNPDRGKASSERFGMRYSPNVEDVLQDPAVDIVVISCETNRHAELAVQAAESGKAIILQKPMALTLQDCDRIIRSVQASKVFFTMAYQMRHDPSNLRIKKLVESGDLGRIGLLRRRHCLPLLFNESFTNGPSSWHIDPIKNMGMFMDDASHAADFIYWIMGRPRSVVAEIDNVLTEVAPDDTGVAIYRFDGESDVHIADGAMAVLMNSSVVLAGENTTEIYGDQGVVVQNHDDLTSMVIPLPPGATALKYYPRYGKEWQDLGQSIPKSHGERIMNVPRALIDAFRLDKEPPVSAQDGRVSVEMVLGAYQSAKEGERITFPK